METITTATYDGITYTLTTDARLSGRPFPGSWYDAKDGDAYTAEWEAYGQDDNGDSHLIRWQFAQTKGSENECNDLPWSDDYITDVISLY